MKSTSTLSNIQTCITKKNSMTTQNFTILNNENTLKELNKNNFNNKKKSPILQFQHITTHPISLWNADGILLPNPVQDQVTQQHNSKTITTATVRAELNPEN